MASTSNASTTTTTHHNPPNYHRTDPNSPNTTFVQADPANFRTIVQKLTGAPHDTPVQKHPLTHPTRPTTTTTPGPKRPAFKLHERRQSAKNLQIDLNTNCNSTKILNSFDHPGDLLHRRQRGFLVSPVSTLDFLAARASPGTPCDDMCARGVPIDEEEERAIAEKGFYLHPSPLSTPRGAEPPELLPLFPVGSPRDNNKDDNDRGCNFFS